MVNKFQTFFEEPYLEITSLIKANIKDNFVIVDLGSNNGNLEDVIDLNSSGSVVHCVDIDESALLALNEKNYSNISAPTYCMDANDFLSSSNLFDVDMILINATLHEINNYHDQSNYLNTFFDHCSRLLKKDGLLIVGDYFYPDDVSDSEVKAYMECQLKEINHADPREKFVPPSLLLEKANSFGYSVVYSNDLRAVKEINRRYCSFVFKKL